MKTLQNISIVLFVLVCLSACSSPVEEFPGQATSTRFTQPTQSRQLQKITPTSTRPTGNPTSTSTATQSIPSDSQGPQITATREQEVCSPLLNIAISELESHVVNPFNPPRLGSDDPHQGVDLAILSTPDRIALAGAPVQAVFSGRVAARIQDRFPYGNGILIETELENIGIPWQESHQLPTLAPTLPPHPSLTCPQTGELGGWDQDVRSLYLLYAHLQSPPEYQIGEIISCGEVIGVIGQSGNALNPHMHLELRIGPAGASFPGIAHYETRATPVEMEAYCIWRVSGLFQLLDPLNYLFQIQTDG